MPLLEYIDISDNPNLNYFNNNTLNTIIELDLSGSFVTQFTKNNLYNLTDLSIKGGLTTFIDNILVSI